MSVVRTAPNLNQVFRFGDFDFSVRSGELRKNGKVLRLQYQPLRVLVVLLEYPGQVVTRDEIRERAWPDDSIRDFDNSLRVAVAKLRQAFGDDPDSPRYIETVPRRGYRWLYPVTVEEKSLNAVDVESPGGAVVAEPLSPQSPAKPDPITSVSLKSSRRTTLMRRIAVTLASWIALLGAIWFLRPQPVKPDPKVSPLSTYPGLEHTPALSPDGKRVAFAWTGANPADPYRVYVKQVGEEGARRITETPAEASDGDPVWTPDGRSILFFRRDGERSGIYQTSIDGGRERLITLTSLHGSPLKRDRFDISPQSTTLVYPSRPAGQQRVALFLLDLATSQSRQLTFPPPESAGDSDPAYSRDGKNIVFERESLDSRQVYVVPATGGDIRLLTDHNRSAIDGLAWTQDDREILLGGQQLLRISASASGQAASAASYVPGPVIYPFLRGDLLVYSQAWDNANIWKLELRGLLRAEGEPAKLIASSRQQAAASFSPDGSQIAFQSDRSGTWEVWKSHRDGSNAVQLTHFGGPLTGTPRWSPDGKQIAFDSRAKEVSEIYLIPADGGAPRQVTANPGGNAVPAWSRDGKWLYYSSSRDGVTNIWKMPVDGGTEQRVTTNGGIYAAESHDGEYLYFSRSSNDPSLWRVPVKGGEEQLVPGAPKPFGCSHWAISASGLYIVDPNGDLNFYDFARRQATTVIHHPGFLTDWSLAVSPDGQEIVWAQIDARAADLMMVENFR
jgi:Tol biopolymer transport system component/DNA-binding winged helix-turn-helix (wHTH) protein